MDGIIRSQLDPIRKRRQRLVALRLAVIGLLAGSVAGVALGAARWLLAWPVPLALVVPVLAAGPLLGALIGLLGRRDWAGTAAAVDAHYRLKDRTITALEFEASPGRGPFHELQLLDAARFLAEAEPGRVAPWRLPRLLPGAGGLLTLALALLLWPAAAPPVAARPEAPLPEVMAEADAIDDNLQEIEDLARKDQNPELARVLQDLRRKADELKQPGVDLREVLAKLSEMQAALAAQQAQYNAGLVDAQLRALGAALSPASALAPIAKALEEDKLERAADELEKLDDPPVDRKEAKAVEEKLKELARGLQEKGLTRLADAAEQLAQGVKGDKGQLRKGTRELAQRLREHQRRRRLQQLLALEQDRLKECKSRCASSMLSWLARRKQQNQSESSGAGKGSGGSLNGEKTKTAVQRRQEQLSGVAGDGPSEVEVTSSPEATQQAGRLPREQYQKYRRMSEAVLATEPIPLGHRETIRRYFDLIRPEGDGAADADSGR
jgi:hypothetical protein